jgi:signal transduction histidine kinase
MESKEIPDIRHMHRGRFRAAIVALIFAVAALHLADRVIYPETEILPPDFFFALVIALLFFLWFDNVKEKYHILWVQKKKEELNELKTKFSLITSHELRTPTAVIKGYVSLLLDKVLGELTDKQKSALDVMNRYFRRLEEINENLTRLHSGKGMPHSEHVKEAAIESVIRTTADDMMPFIDKRKQKLSVEVVPPIPEVMMDQGGIRQVLVNLLLNAIRFTPDSGTIVVRARESGNEIRVEVTDTGIGIPKEKLDTIFESFYEIQDTDKHSSGSIEFRSGGMGLGLTIAKRIVEAHGGKIWAESKEGKSSNFIFTLPKKRVS